MKLPLKHRLLPANAIARLQEAAATPIAKDEPLARIAAIERTTTRIKREHPHLFRGD